MRIVYERAAVRVPATTANMGPGFDSFGMAFRYYDEVSVRPTTGTTRVIVEGVGAETVPTDDDNLVVQALRAGLDAVGAPQAGFEMRCVNRLPHGGGMGSSASAAVAGLMLALAGRPDLLMAGTEDRLHQEYRRGVLPASMAVMDSLREQGYPAVISGAGPTVLVLSTLADQTRFALENHGWSVLSPGIDTRGAVLTS